MIPRLYGLSATASPAVTNAGLAVYDVDGRELSARFAREGERLTLAGDERGARYPLTIDPIAQQAYLKASNTDAEDTFGFSVAVFGRHGGDRR